MHQNHSSDFKCRLQAFAPLLSYHLMLCVACQTLFYNWRSRELPFCLSHKKKYSLGSLFSSRTWRSSVLTNDLTSHHSGGSLTQQCSLEPSESFMAKSAHCPKWLRVHTGYSSSTNSKFLENRKFFLRLKSQTWILNLVRWLLILQSHKKYNNLKV